MVSSELAVVAACAVLLLALHAAAALAGWSARARAADAELALERDRRERAEGRADLAEKRVATLAHVGREYLARVPADGRVDRARLRLLLDETADAAGSASTAGPVPEGADASGAGLA